MDLTEGVDLKTRRIPDALSDASCSTKPDSDFLSFNDNRHLSNTTGMREHFLQFTAFTSYIYVLRSVSIGRPGIFCVRSTAFSINDHFLIHESGSFPKLFATRNGPFLEFRRRSGTRTSPGGGSAMRTCRCASYRTVFRLRVESFFFPNRDRMGF